MAKRTTLRLKKLRQPQVWFKPIRGSYLPVSWKGWLTYVPYVAYLYATYAFLTPDRSPLETILFLIPYWVAGIIIMHWIAKLKS